MSQNIVKVSFSLASLKFGCLDLSGQGFLSVLGLFHPFVRMS